MYTIDDDKTRRIETLPQSSIGAPCPMLVAGEHTLTLAYYLEYRPEDRGLEDACILVRFTSPYAHLFGPPNDEAFSGHPLAARGLMPYQVFEVANSSWIASLVKMNSVHPAHRPEHFRHYRHFIFAFHDSTFECIAKDFQWSESRGCIWSALKALEDAS